MENKNYAVYEIKDEKEFLLIYQTIKDGKNLNTASLQETEKLKKFIKESKKPYIYIKYKDQFMRVK